MRAIDYFDKSADAAPDRPAIVDGDRKYSYRDVREISRGIARAMWAAGSRGEERAAIYSPNNAGVLFCLLGIMRSGCAWVPINYRNALEANIAYMNYVEASFVFYHSSFGSQIEELKARVRSLRQLICIDTDAGPHPSLEQFIEGGRDVAEFVWADPYGNIDRLVGLVPTGGTTGPAKGVRVTNLAWGTMIDMVVHYWKSGVEKATGPVCLNTAPLSHAAGPVAFSLFALGGTNVVMSGFNAGEVLANIERFRVTHLFLPPTAFYALLEHPDVGKFDYSSLRVFLLAGSPVSPDRFKKGVEVFGPCMCQCYGQTECQMLITWLDAATVAAAAGGDHPNRLRSCGKATSAVSVAVMDEQGNLLPVNERGEIVARGPLVTPGYYNMPEATAEIRAHGWHHTGDIGYRDEDGFF